MTLWAKEEAVHRGDQGKLGQNQGYATSVVGL